MLDNKGSLPGGGGVNIPEALEFYSGVYPGFIPDIPGFIPEIFRNIPAIFNLEKIPNFR